MIPGTKSVLLLLSFILIIGNATCNVSRIPNFVLEKWNYDQDNEEVEEDCHNCIHSTRDHQFSIPYSDEETQKKWCVEAANRFLSELLDNVSIQEVYPSFNKKIIFESYFLYDPPPIDFLVCVADGTKKGSVKKHKISFYGTRLYLNYDDIFRNFVFTDVKAVKNKLFVVADLGDWTFNKNGVDRKPPNHRLGNISDSDTKLLQPELPLTKIPSFVMEKWNYYQDNEKITEDCYSCIYSNPDQKFLIPHNDEETQKNWCIEASNRFLSELLDNVSIREVYPSLNKKIIFKDLISYNLPSVDFVVCVAEGTKKGSQKKRTVSFYGTRLYTTYNDIFRNFVLTDVNAGANKLSIVADLGDWASNAGGVDREPPNHRLENRSDLNNELLQHTEQPLAKIPGFVTQEWDLYQDNEKVVEDFQSCIYLKPDQKFLVPRSDEETQQKWCIEASKRLLSMFLHNVSIQGVYPILNKKILFEDFTYYVPPAVDFLVCVAEGIKSDSDRIQRVSFYGTRLYMNEYDNIFHNFVLTDVNADGNLFVVADLGDWASNENGVHREPPNHRLENKSKFDIDMFRLQQPLAKIPNIVMEKWIYDQNNGKVVNDYRACIYSKPDQKFLVPLSDKDTQKKWCIEAANRFLSQILDNILIRKVHPSLQKKIISYDIEFYDLPSVDFLVCVAEGIKKDSDKKRRISFYGTRLYAAFENIFRNFVLTDVNADQNKLFVIADLGDWASNVNGTDREPPNYHSENKDRIQLQNQRNQNKYSLRSLTL